MRPIQLVLISLLVVVGVTYFSRLHSNLLNRAIVLLFAIVGIVMVVMPDQTTAVAQLVGVGRGADFLLYFGLVGLVFICLLLYSKLRELDSSITDLVRSIAIEQARLPPSVDERNAAMQVLPKGDMKDKR